MRWLVACETSGRTREALRRRGHDAVSCDLLPAVDGSPHHIQGNAFDILGDGWDGMIAHPTCTKLTVAAAWCLYHPDDKDLPFGERRPHPDFPDRRREQDEAAEDFMRFVDAPIERKIIENPVGVMSTRYRAPDQIVQPYWFGDDASKKTCLWLFRVPKLVIPPKQLWAPPRIVADPRTGRPAERWSNQTDSGQNRLAPSEDRWSKRSETYPGIAEAIAAACSTDLAPDLLDFAA
jgi:hypothetical protein